MSDDAKYLPLILEPLRMCANYKPRFGQGRAAGLTLEQFRDLYRNDAFYSWFGLDNPLLYAAHKAAGGMTSIYRQIGIGCERVFRSILQDSLGLSSESVAWSYEVTRESGTRRTLSLDGRALLAEIKDAPVRRRFHDWMKKAAGGLGVDKRVSSALAGSVFEVRQGYKSKDSKRQNADLSNAATAYIQGYLPCAVILSSQIDTDILTRYRAERWVVLTGVIGLKDPLRSTYDFTQEVLGFDLAGFFERNQQVLHQEIDGVLRALLSPEAS
ncbi:MAG TPA: hypothetical protein DD490_15035 [Acidobacteria bacterium]|nr:hypothetical protein [Acidobacteriota bacterium]